MSRTLGGLLAVALALPGCTVERTEPPREAAVVMTVTSPAFAAGDSIPAKHSCEGGDVAPALSWSGVPAGTRSLALVVTDPDAPGPTDAPTTWVHWVVYGLPPGTTGLPEGSALPPGARQGLNDWKRAAYGGPCPPVGRHRYVHTVYALDADLGDLGQPDRTALLRAMEGHILAQGELVGLYRKSGP